MGLFGSKTVTTVGTQVQRVIDDATLPNSVRDGVLKNLMDKEAGGEQAVEFVMDELVNGIALRADRMYRYGANGYVFGLPKATLYSSLSGREASEAAIESLVGEPVSLAYYHFGPLNNLHFAWHKLATQYGYDSVTNQLVVGGQAVFLKDMQVVVTNASLAELANGSLDQWGMPPNAGPRPDKYTALVPPPTPFAVDPAASGDYVRVDYCWLDGSQVKSGSFTLPVTGFDQSQDYHQARYILGNGRAGYWIYQANTGQYPAVDAVFDASYADGGTFFPFTYFRYEKKSTIADTTTEEYRSSKKLCDYLNLDYDAVATGINENPDIKDVEQAMLVMAVPANTDNAMEQRYLFDFFSTIHLQMGNAGNKGTLEMPPEITLSLQKNEEQSSIVIQDRRFKMALSFDQMVKRKILGSIGAVGSHASGFSKALDMQTVQVIGGGSTTWNTNKPRHWYRRQITDSVYEEVIVIGLKMTYWIFEGYTTTGDEEDDILLVPLDMAITKHYSVPDKERLYARSLQYVFNSRIVTKLKWYQTGIFKAIMIIIAVVIAIMSDFSTWELILEAIALGAIDVAIAMIINIMLEKLLIQMAFRLFVKVVGTKIAFMAAVIAAIAGVYQIANAGTMTPSAAELLQASTGFSQAAQMGMQQDYQNLLREQTEFEQYVKKQTKVLEDAEELLNGGNIINPLIIYGESPNQFYQRTVHSGNIGILGIDVVSSYVDVALQLPTLNQTLGGNDV